MTPILYHLVRYDDLAYTVAKLRELINGKSDIGHRHLIDDIESSDGIGLQEVLDGILPPLASKLEAELGTVEQLRSWNPERVSQAVRGTNLEGLLIDPAPQHLLVVTEADSLIMAISKLQRQVTNHYEDFNNPHRVTWEQVEAPSIYAFDDHINNKNNPHEVRWAQILCHFCNHPFLRCTCYVLFDGRIRFDGKRQFNSSFISTLKSFIWLQKTDRDGRD